jgi:deoxyribodipyrimidine photo-lyase
MVRDKRAHDNWALLEAQKIAIEQKVPLLVCFQFMGSYEKANIRQYQFLFEGLKETEKELHKYQIGFTLLKGAAEVQIPKIIDQYVVGHLVTDFSPLKVYRNRLKKVLSKVSIPVTQVDAHNIVPVWHASNKKEFAAYTIRPKIKKLLPTFLSEIPKIKKHPFYLKNMPTKTDWSFVNSLEIDYSVKMPDWILPGEKNAIVQLKKLKKSLAGYDDGRNDPTKNHLSNLSPFFHYGHIAPQRVALEITKSSLPLKDRDAFLEEMIV